MLGGNATWHVKEFVDPAAWEACGEQAGIHTLLQTNHVCTNFQNCSQQRKVAAPFGVQRRARLHHLCNQMLNAPAIVLQSQVPFQLGARETSTLSSLRSRKSSVTNGRRDLGATLPSPS